MATMSDIDPLAAEVLVTAEVSARDEQTIVEIFRDLDVIAHPRMVPTRRGMMGLEWVVLATLPLHALLSGFGSAAADDLARGLKNLVARVVGPKCKTVSAPRVMVLQDAATRLQIVLEADLPAEAYQELVALDLSAFRQGPVHYDRQRGRWRSELDEWQRFREENPGPA